MNLKSILYRQEQEEIIPVTKPKKVTRKKKIVEFDIV